MEEVCCNKEMIANFYMEVAEAFSKLNLSLLDQRSIIEPFATRALGLYIASQDSDEDPNDLTHLPILRHIILSEPKYQNSILVQRVNEIFKRVNLQPIW